ncbi:MULTISPECIES: hypothetical protein [Streptomyces]|jgi:hypothetical protein|uniref:hypothetical protein n=1 Tax=Streptomyces TaxID=1883 RepID=UPI0004C17617|nr:MULTISPECIES: hypothetical protein [Streptomyces]WSQ21756.1 hypothetical protein OG237_32175 [Streptomyces zaomyceticus]
MNIGDWAAIVGAAGGILGGGGVFVARATVKAAKATAAPQQQAADLAVLQATVKRVDEENTSLRARQARCESLLRAFSSTVNRWADQMNRAGIEPEPVHPLVDEYNRTGV